MGQSKQSAADSGSLIGSVGPSAEITVTIIRKVGLDLLCPFILR